MSPAETHSCPVCSEGKPRFSHKALLYPAREWDVETCPGCGAFYFWPIPGPAEIAHCYPHSYFRDFFKQYWKDYYKGRALAAALTRWRASGRFLDVGCALGTLLAGVRDFSQWNVFGLEYSTAAAKGGQALHHIPIVNGGLTAAPWPAGYFDYIHANNVLEHETDPVNAVASAARLLNPGGRLHLTLPNGPVDAYPNRILYQRRGRVVGTRHSGHVFYFSRQALEALLRRAGLKVLAIRNFHFKTALKAHGWTPGAYNQFSEDAPPAPAEPAGGESTLEDYRKFIPPQPSWALYHARYKLRRLWRWRWLDWGYDLEVLAEK